MSDDQVVKKILEEKQTLQTLSDDTVRQSDLNLNSDC